MIRARPYRPALAALVLAACGLTACQTLGRKPAVPAPAPPAAAPPPRVVIVRPTPPPPAPAPPAPPRTCVPKGVGSPPRYPDTDQALRSAAGAADRYQLMAAGRLLRQQRLEELERVLAGCR